MQRLKSLHVPNATCCQSDIKLEAKSELAARFGSIWLFVLAHDMEGFLTFATKTIRRKGASVYRSILLGRLVVRQFSVIRRRTWRIADTEWLMSDQTEPKWVVMDRMLSAVFEKAFIGFVREAAISLNPSNCRSEPIADLCNTNASRQEFRSGPLSL